MLRAESRQGVPLSSGTPSSSEEERDDVTRRRDSRYRSFETPNNAAKAKRAATPQTVTEMTPSPFQSPLMDSVTPNMSALRSPIPFARSRSSFSDVQQGFLDNNLSTALFRDGTPASNRKRNRSHSRRSRLSQSLLLHGYESPVGVPERRRTSSHRSTGSFGNRSLPSLPSREFSSSESSPDASPPRLKAKHGRMSSFASVEHALMATPRTNKNRGRAIFYVWCFLLLSVMSALIMIGVTQKAAQVQRYEPTHPEFPAAAAGLRGPMTSGHWDEHHETKRHRRASDHHSHHKDAPKKHQSIKEPKHHVEPKEESVKTVAVVKHAKKGSSHKKTSQSSSTTASASTSQTSPLLPKIALPPPISKRQRKFDWQDPNLYSSHSSKRTRVVALDPTSMGSSLPHPRKIKTYPADFTDNTQLYSILDSSDERLGHMEIREPYEQGECVPMQDWQTTYHPSCNAMHEVAMEYMGEEQGTKANLFGTKGFWRYAWRLDVDHLDEQDTVVLKTLKYEHNFEDAHFEHDRVDAVAMERLTSSPHVINVFGFCGHSVVTEYADGSRVGELADKSKKKPLARLAIARDIANGLADVHGIDGDGNATFVHLDINPANVVSIGGTLKLNDFNIGIIRKWNTTSNTPCGFPAQYPNPQWRSPEEARNEQNLTEKVDVFSMGHIFFRLVCGHEPWNKLEPGGRPSKEEVNVKVQRGDLPFIPDHVRESQDPEVQAIYQAMLACYTFDPSERPSAREIANSLEETLAKLTAKQQ